VILFWSFCRTGCDLVSMIPVMRCVYLENLLVLRISRVLSAVLLIVFVANVSARISVEPNQMGATDYRAIGERIREKEDAGKTQGEIILIMQEEMAENTKRYFYTDDYGWVDGRHFFLMARISQWAGRYGAIIIGFFIELDQWLKGEPSGFSPEDLPSDVAGAWFGSGWVRPGRMLSESFMKWCEGVGGRLVDDPVAGLTNLPMERER